MAVTNIEHDILKDAIQELEEAKKLVRKNDDYIKSKPQAVQQVPAMQGAKTVNAEYESKIENVQNMAVEDIKYMQKDSKSSNYKVRSKK